LVRDDLVSKGTAFADAIDVLGHFLQQGSVRPAEAAGLLRWLHSHAEPGFIDDVAGKEVLLTTLHGELVGQSTDTLRSMLTALTASTTILALGTPAFAAAVDIIDTGRLAGDTDPIPLVDAYIKSVSAGQYTLSANRLGVSGAAALFELATRSSSDVRKNFLYPAGIQARLAAGKTSEENPFTLAETIGRSIRAHIRVLSRAIVGWKDGIPNDLTEALVNAVHLGIVTQVKTLSQVEKVPVAAFSPRYETQVFGGSLDRPIAADMAAALAVLTDKSAKRLLSEILKTDEPMMLAQLLSYSPHAMRASIAARLDELTPSEAGNVYSLTEAQARIEELLSAGALNAATRFIDVEQDLKTMGRVPGREITRLHNTLRLHFLRGDWSEIENTQLPKGLPLHEQPSVQDTISFYKALTALKKLGGDLQGAEQVFAQLQHRRPDVVAYAQNLFATRVSILLQGNVFAELRGAPVLHARHMLSEAQQMMDRARITCAFDAEVFKCNKALVLLALGSSDQAMELLTACRDGRLQETVAAYTAVALSRMERVPEAVSALKTAEMALGSTDLLKAAREHIQNGKAYSDIATVLSQDDLRARVKLALQDLSEMAHPQQASVFRSEPGAFEALVMDYVRAAAASILSLVPMMKNITLDACEDDLSAVLGELLTARSAFLGWSWKDQSKGGFTPKANPGERDLVLHRNGTELAVIEAVVCKHPVTQKATRDDLKSHFQKLYAYTSCPLLFHVTYSYVPEPASVIDYLEDVAEHDPPPGFRYIGSDPLPHTDSQPPGFVARYAGDFGVVRVGFLVLDMGKRRQLDAAKVAGESNPRKGKSGDGGKSKKGTGAPHANAPTLKSTTSTLPASAPSSP
jgi:tetratricopeptide (TPR) repeat protein